MSSINGLSGSLPPSYSPSVTPKVSDTSAPAAARGSDSVELSGGVAGYLKILKGNDVRSDKVASVKASIDDGSYDSDFKLDVAVGRLLDDLDL